MARISEMNVSSGRLQLLIVGVLAGIALLFVAPKLVEEVYPDDLTVIQAPVSGNLTWYTTQGWAMQSFGDVTVYKKRATVNFPQGSIDPTTKKPTGGISIRFSDGGHATMFGSVQFKLPEDPKRLTTLHSSYRGNETVVDNLLKTVLNKSVYLTGTLMTSKESYAEKKNDLIHYVTDQMQNGVYRTRQTTKWVKDEITGQSKEVTLAEILLDKDGNIQRQEDSVLNQFGITAFNFTIDTMPYDDVIEAQIKQQQGITMAVQTSIAEAKQKDQQALTAEAEGRATIAKAKAEQETEKVRAVTKAEQEKQVAITVAMKEKEVAETAAKRNLAVAEYAKQEAEQYKAKLILEGQGESEKRKLILLADGALAQKLATYQAVQAGWAAAFAQYKGNIVPSYVSGPGGQQSANNGAQQFMDLMAMKAAKDLTLDLSTNIGGK